MARYKPIDTNRRLLPVNLAEQILLGTFEHAVHHLLEHALDLSGFGARFRNDPTGAPANPPAVLLKVVLCAYARGIVSCRAIARLREDHVTFIALCGARTPHFTTLAAFVSAVGPDIARVYAAVLAVCDQHGLIGREMFALDGVKLPSNAFKRRSGKRVDFKRQAEKLEPTAATMLARHRAEDSTEDSPPDPGGARPSRRTRETERLARLERDAAQLRTWLATHPDERRSPQGAVRLSNRTDPVNAKVATGKGVVKGYTGVAAVDARAPIIVEARADGTGTEQEVLLPVVAALAPHCTPTTLLTADAGYHSEANLRALAEQDRSALIADTGMRRRDARFAAQERHQHGPDPLHDKSRTRHQLPVYQPHDFTYDPVARICVCPAGKSAYRKGKDLVIKGNRVAQFRGAKRDCPPCPLRARCLRTPETTATRQVMFFEGRAPGLPETNTRQMQRRLDTPDGRAQYDRRFATVEPVFANLRHNKGLARFTLRDRTKVDGQWKRFCLVHRIEKLAHAGYAA
jgi:transposase